MKVSNLLFSAPMVKAIIREIEQPGQGKTQTRRILPVQPHHVSQYGWERGKGASLTATTLNGIDTRHPLKHWAGDLIYVREAWRSPQKWDATKPRDLPPRTMTVFFEAGGSIGGETPLPKSGERPAADYVPIDTRHHQPPPSWAGKLRPGMFLPRWASRLTLEVTDVRIERLNDISPEDAAAEGVNRRSPKVRQMWLFGADAAEREKIYLRACPWEFEELWDSINGDRPGLAWKYNPWVVAISFRPHLINIDAYLERSAP